MYLNKLFLTALNRFLALVSFGMLTACAQQGWDADMNLGKSVNNAIRAQSIHPDGPPKDRVLGGMDGVSAKATIDNYQKTFITPFITPQIGSAVGGVSGSSGSPAGAGAGGSSSQSGTTSF
jgi:hypothetical protein